MASVRRGKAFPYEYVAQMAAAVGALDLRPMTVGVRQALHGSWYLLIESRPATTSVKLVIGSIELGIAPPADIETFLIKVVVFSREGLFRALSFDYESLLRGKRIVA